MASLETLGNILRGNEEYSSELLKFGILDIFFSLLDHKNIKILKKVYKTISNVAATRELYISVIENNPIYLEKLFILMKSDWIPNEVFNLRFHLFIFL